MAQPADEIPELSVLVEADARGRVHLGHLTAGHTLYRAHRDVHGVIILEPAWPIPAEPQIRRTEDPVTYLGIAARRRRRRPDPEQGDMPPGHGGVL